MKDPQTKTAEVRIPEALQRSVPREVVLAAGGIAAVAGAILLVLGALAVCILGPLSIMRARRVEARMEAEGRTAAGVVLDVARTRKSPPKDIVQYQFTVEGRTLLGSVAIPVQSRHDPPSLRSGAVVEVRYLPDAPAVHWIAGYPPALMPWFAIVLPAGAMLAGAGLTASSVLHQLLAEGRPTIATVKSVGKGKNAKRAYLEFVLLSGATAEPHLDFSHKPPQPGERIVVVYDSENPRSLMRYPSALVRVAEPGEG